LLALGEEGLAFVVGGFALVQGAQDLGLLFIGEALLLLFVGVGFGWRRAAAPGE